MPARNLPARLDAAQAEDAAVLEILYKRCSIALDLFAARDGEVGLLDAVREYEVLKIAFAARVADGTFEWMVSEDKLQVVLPHGKEPVGAGADRHAVLRCGLARSHGVGVAVDLDYADAAGAQGKQVRVVAQGRDVDPVLPGRLENRPALGRLYRLTVYSQSYH